MQANLSLIKQRDGEYGDGCFISPIKAIATGLFVCHFASYLAESCCGENCMENFTVAMMPMFRLMCAELQLLEIWMKIKHFLALRAPSHEAWGNKVKISPISYIFEDPYFCKLYRVAVPAWLRTFTIETKLLILCRDKYWCLLWESHKTQIMVYILIRNINICVLLVLSDSHKIQLLVSVMRVLRNTNTVFFNSCTVHYLLFVNQTKAQLY